MATADRKSATRRRKLPCNVYSCYDLNVPIPSSSSSSKQQQQNLAHAHQARLHQLGYHGLAFCHTAYNGRLRAHKDDADIALPWKVLLPSSLTSTSPSPLAAKNNVAHRTSSKNTIITSSSNCSSCTGTGRTNSLTGMKIYRRLNIIVEEVSDVSRILLCPANAAINSVEGGNNSNDYNKDDVKTLLQKYDIISLQPMNQSVLQSICELL